MAKAVFITKINPAYDDLPEMRYHFPQTYLNKAKKTIGDWILYYEPRRDGGRQAYFATARVNRIEADSQRDRHYYAYVEDYIEFPQPVPFREGSQSYEGALLLPDGKVNLGLFQRAIHHLPEHEYMMIVQVGMGSVRLEDDEHEYPPALVAEPEAVYNRPLVQQLIERPWRERAFAHVVREAYDATCSMTGLKLINGSGHCEIEAAHIRPVSKHGPDSPRNGLALSRTVHWLFDRGILSVEDNGKILMARKLMPESVKFLIKPDGYITLPKNSFLRPHPQFLQYHRENIFKG